jgi:bifunctional DNA-binding transcriptional regulator/antitoxin component of YhaV-PrlF toxin-antitoxin module
MTTTVNVLPKGKMELPEEFRKRQRIKEGTTLRVTEVGEGLYVTPLHEPTEKELREVIAAAGSLSRRQSAQEERMVDRIVEDCRKEKRRKRG